jgi:outer membrane protein OmpA-like peptidoglycan-associated protein
MQIGRYTQLGAILALALGATVPAGAHSPAPPDPWVQMQTSSAMVGVGGQSGEGQLTLANLGTNCTYPFQVSGFGAGVQVGISRASAAGPVKNLMRVEDFAGNYAAAQGEATVIGGGGGMSLTNNATKVSMSLTSQTSGLNIGIAGQGVTISMPVAPVNAPNTLVLEFGYNKDWLNKANRAKLDQFLGAWKCRYGTIEVVGHTDAVGKEDTNLELSKNRDTAVRDYLIGGGVYAGRLAPIAVGENNQAVPTYQGVRLRATRVVVVTIK